MATGIFALIITVTCLLMSPAAVQCSKIGLFTLMGSASHKEVMYGIAEALSERGHSMTYYTIFDKPKKEIKGLKEIYLKEVDYSSQLAEKGLSFFDPSGNVDMKPFMRAFTKISEEVCDKLLQVPDFIEMSKSNHDVFDVSLLDSLYQECALPFLHQASKSLIMVSTSDLLSEWRWHYAMPCPYSILPSFVSAKPTFRMNFIERMRNVFNHVVFSLHYFGATMNQYQKIVTNRMPDLVSIDEATRRVALILVSTNPAISQQLPISPMVKSIGGIGLKETSGRMDKDLSDFIEGSGSDGFIFVSFGTIVPSQMMPAHAKKALFDAFSKIPQRVVWRFENTENWKIPPNIKLVKWVPQVAILAHPKIKAFFMHGGLNGILEAINYAVPCVVLPVFADQPINARTMADNGMAELLYWSGLTETQILNAIHDVITVSSYKQSAVRLQSILRDRLVTPKEEAAYWVEYVIRHNGSTHFRIKSDHLNVFQYLLLDVFALIAAVLAVVAYVLYKVLSTVAKCFRKRDDKVNSSKKRN